MSSAKIPNRFTDSFKLLSTAAKSVQNLNIQVTGILNRILPSRILSKTNIFNTAIDVSQDLSTMIMLHVEDSLVENNILIAQKELSVRGLATLTGHNAVRPISSSGVLKIVFNPSIQLVTPTVIIDMLQFKCANNNLTYCTKPLDSRIVPSNIGTIYVPVQEGSWVSRKFVAEGLKFETLRIDDLQPIDNDNCFVYVNGEKWQAYSSLYDMGSETKGVFVKNGISNQVDICFGDNVHGKVLNEGDAITVEYLTCSGESGNVELNADFKSMSGFYNAEGIQIDISEFATISVESGFQLGSNGEDIERTRQLAGYSSRSLVFARPENIKAFLSRLSVISHIEAWTLEDDMIFYLLVLPNIKWKLSSYRDYLTIPIEQLQLNSRQKASILEAINNSGSQLTSTEIVWKEPVFDKYAVFVYIQSTSINKASIKEQVESNIAEVFLSHTFLDVDMNTTELIPQSLLVDAVWSIDDITQVSIDIVNERNELARINKYYDETVVSYVGSVKQTTTRKVEFDPFATNPNLGFDELGGILTGSKERIPLLRGDFSKWNRSSEPVLLQKSIYVFYKTINGYEEL